MSSQVVKPYLSSLNTWLFKDTVDHLSHTGSLILCFPKGYRNEVHETESPRFCRNMDLQ